MTRRPFVSPRRADRSWTSLARPSGPARIGSLHRAQIEQIRRTVRRAPEVMVKVTGGGKTVGAVACAPVIHQPAGRAGARDGRGTAGVEGGAEDTGQRLASGALGRSIPQAAGSDKPARTVKLVHNIVLSMPAPTPPDKVLAAAKIFAREKFALKHRYAMALHTHQQHPHVHLVVKAEDERRPALAYRQSHAARVARGFRPNDAGPGHRRERHLACRPRSKQTRRRDAAYRAKGAKVPMRCANRSRVSLQSFPRPVRSTTQRTPSWPRPESGRRRLDGRRHRFGRPGRNYSRRRCALFCQALAAGADGSGALGGRSHSTCAATTHVSFSDQRRSHAGSQQ